MAGWRNKTNSFGNDVAVYSEVIDGISIKAVLEDEDGDAVAWVVRENGAIIAYGSVRAEDGPEKGKTSSDEEWAWNTAKLYANGYICAIPGYPMFNAFPKEIFNKIADKFVMESMKKYLLDKCDRTIKNFEATNPNHPLIAAIDAALGKTNV